MFEFIKTRLDNRARIKVLEELLADKTSKLLEIEKSVQDAQEDRRKDEELKRNCLKKYFKAAAEGKVLYKLPLLSSHEALKHFGNIWGSYKSDAMMMITAAEYEFITDNQFDDKQISAVKQVLGKILVFLKDCSKEYEMSVKIQEMRASRK